MAESQRIVALCGLLARPALAESHRAELASLAADPAWKPVPSLPCFNMLLPLFRHHLQLAGLAEETFLLPPAAEGLAVPSFGELAVAWIRRRTLQDALLAQLRAGGVERIMLIKGAALAPLYPTPALRQMCDLDIVLAPAELARAEAVLTAHGWTAREDESSQVWRHGASGMLLDLHVPEGQLAARILAEATCPIPDSRIPNPVFPTPAAHLLILALHAANNGGNRLWRDICDAHVLLGQADWDPQEAWDLAGSDLHLRVPLAAFVAFLNRWGRPVRPVPEASLSPEEQRSRDHHLQLYTEFATDALSPAQLGLVKQTFRPASEHWAALRRALSQRSAPHDTPAERDPALGDLPAAGSAARQWLRLRFLGHALMKRQLLRYRALALAHTEVSRDTKLFRAPGKGGIGN